MIPYIELKLEIQSMASIKLVQRLVKLAQEIQPKSLANSCAGVGQRCLGRKFDVYQKQLTDIYQTLSFLVISMKKQLYYRNRIKDNFSRKGF